MAIIDNISTLKTKEGTLTNNKVSNFAYDNDAYANDNANGVAIYNYNNHNNIPVSDPSVIKVNPTVVAKGFRSQFSTLPRMLVNHFFGRISYNLNKTVDVLNGLLSSLYSYIGQPNGLATLDNTGRLPYTQLPLSAVEYKGAWNANTNTPTLVSGTGTFGDEYIVSVQGTQNIGEGSITYRVGDRVIYNGSIWQRIPASSVRTVNMKMPDANGNVTLNAEDIVTPDVYGYTDAGKAGWVRNTSFTGNIRCYMSKYVNGLWVMGSQDGLWWSEDGKNWTQSVETAGSYFQFITYEAGMWEAYTASGGTYTGIWWSTDGKYWTRGTISGGGYLNVSLSVNGDTHYHPVIFANGVWVCKDKYWSADGKEWTACTGLPSLPGYAIDYANGIFVMTLGGSGSTDGGVYWSTDGKSWTISPTIDVQTLKFDYVQYANGIWVLSGGGIWWSTDGKNWTVSNMSSQYLDSSGLYYADGLWLESSSNELYYSTDGKVWTKNTNSGLPNATLGFIEYINSLWFIKVYNYSIYWSTDGMSWEHTTGSTGTSIFDISYGNRLYIVCRGGTDYGMCYSEGIQTNNVKDILDWLMQVANDLTA